MSMNAIKPAAEVVVYDEFTKSDGTPYTLDDYALKWLNPFGPLEMASASGDTRSFAGENFFISAVPFRTANDTSVFDHLKYLAISKKTFEVPVRGSLTFSTVITAETPGTQHGRIIEGVYTQSGAKYARPALEGQQAAAVMNMMDFGSGQLFDWFVSGSRAFTLVERLPSTVTGNGSVGLDKAYTQIVDEIPIGSGPHHVATRFTRDGSSSKVEFLLDGKIVSTMENVGVPLDRQGKPYTGLHPSYGPGEPLAGQLNGFVLGHGLFSLLDAFPYQHPERPDLSVSIPLENRAFGQGVRASFGRFTVETIKFD